MSKKVAIAATGPASLGSGQQVVAEGGNAVDAAIAAAITAMSSEPGIVSLAGGAFVTVWPASGSPVVLDGNVVMPGRGLPREAFGGGVREVVTTYGGGVTMYAGHGSVAVPGALSACELAVARFGSQPWKSVVAPAAGVCRDGYPIGGAASRYLDLVADPLFGHDDGARRLTRRTDGSPFVAGDLSRNPELAAVLDEVATRGASILTTGELGRTLAAEMAAHGGLITEADLAAYEVVVREPVRRTARRLGRRGQPATVGRWAAAGSDARRARAHVPNSPNWTVGHGTRRCGPHLGRRPADPASSARLPHRGPRRLARPRRRRARTARRGRPARAGRAADLGVDGAHLGGRHRTGWRVR